MKQFSVGILLCIFILSCTSKKEEQNSSKPETVSKTETIPNYPNPKFTLKEANKLIELPLACVETQYPNKLGQTIGGEEDLKEPKALHPIFYGCFDWHSAAHGYWSMVTLLQQFPEMDNADAVRTILKKNITKENVAIELAYFEVELNKSYERTYGWAWLLKLAETLHNWEDPLATALEETLQPLTNNIVNKYLDFLPKLVYPIRVGEHTNTAFGLSFAYDYAVSLNNSELKNLIEKRAIDFYNNDSNCPITWEPSGYDFLSPCFEEIDIMRRVLPKEKFKAWLQNFMPQLADNNFTIAVGEVSDRSDGKLVHLDGLNFSRAWVLYGLANEFSEYEHLSNVANQHIQYSYPNLVGDSYEGGHWLGSFAIYALNQHDN